MKKTIPLLLLAIVAGTTGLMAGTEVDGICYNFDDEHLTAEVTSKGAKYSGTITIPATVTHDDKTYDVTSIGSSAFYNCGGLTSVSLPNSMRIIGNGAFIFCENLVSVNIPDGVTSIGYDAFDGCHSLESINIPEGITSIGYATFYECSSLTSVTFPSTLTSIVDQAFVECSSLTSINISSNVTEIGFGAFMGCSSLETISVEAGNPNYDSRNGCNAIIATASNTLLQACNNTVIPNTVTAIESSAFWGTGMTSITIPNSVTSIGSHAFRDCGNLVSVTLSNSIESIEEYTFYWCPSLETINIPEGVKSIGGNAFSHCSSLTTVTIPSSTTKINFGAFGQCNALNEIHVSWTSLAGVTIASSAFSDVPLSTAKLHIPYGTIDVYSAASPWNSCNFVYRFNDNADNTDYFEDNYEEPGALVDGMDFDLGRTLYKDGKYNTLCLPFDVSAEELADEEYPLYGATLKELESAEVSGGALYLTLTDATSIEAGKPYLISWEDGEDLVNPSFTDIHIHAYEPQTVEGGALNFVGTLAPKTFTAADAEKTLFLGANDRFHWPTAGSTLRGFRAYFEISDTPAGAPAQRGMTVRIVERPNTTTGGAHVQGDKVQSTKVLRDGQIVIIRNGKEYNALGQRTL